MATTPLQAESVSANPDARTVAWDASCDLDTLALDIENAAALIRMAASDPDLDGPERLAINGMGLLVEACHRQTVQLSAKYEALGAALREASGHVVVFRPGKGGDNGAE